ncbi:MAG: hypothetical protein GY694_04780 [Gammaproteobacteria bacterium]|nr:hypothetical protein [Gammaproteobacteria bacterium]
MRTIFKLLLLFAALLFSSLVLDGNLVTKVAADSEYDWKMVRDEDGIQVYLKSFWADDIKSFRGTVHINSSLDSLLAIIMDIDACTNWVHRCKNPLLLSKVSFSENYHYQIHQLPFPAKNREFIFHSKMEHFPDTGVVSIQMKAVPGFCQKHRQHCAIIPKTSLIRVEHSHGHYLLKPTGDHSTRVTWTHHTNPGGYLPRWLINSLIVEMPFRTLQGLRKAVRNSQYQKTQLIVNQAGRIIGFNTDQ